MSVEDINIVLQSNRSSEVDKPEKVETTSQIKETKRKRAR